MINKGMVSDLPETSQETISGVKIVERTVNEIRTELSEEEKQKRSGTELSGNAVKAAVVTGPHTVNAINKGSKLTGNLVVTQNLEVTGDVEGDITSEENSNICIRGNCKGNISTKGGSVEIEGHMSGGDIIAGGYVKVTGKFHGGKIQARERININGEFSGTLESDEIEVGADAMGTGEILYRKSLSIQKGAKIEGSITRMEAERKKDLEPKPDVKEQQQKKGFFSKSKK
jgi:cytoskeletal protein CcmA (bactofilin family)